MPFDPTYQAQIQTQQGARIMATGPLAVMDMSQTPASQIMQSSADGLTAKAGGGQAGATPLLFEFNRVTTVATLNDSVLLPAAIAGVQLFVANAGSLGMNVFPSGTDQINALGASAAFAVASGKSVQFYSAKNGQWHTILSA
jgi:hypothetical protein